MMTETLMTNDITLHAHLVYLKMKYELLLYFKLARGVMQTYANNS